MSTVVSSPPTCGAAAGPSLTALPAPIVRYILLYVLPFDEPFVSSTLAADLKGFHGSLFMSQYSRYNRELDPVYDRATSLRIRHAHFVRETQKTEALKELSQVCTPFRIALRQDIRQSNAYTKTFDKARSSLRIKLIVTEELSDFPSDDEMNDDEMSDDRICMTNILQYKSLKCAYFACGCATEHVRETLREFNKAEGESNARSTHKLVLSLRERASLTYWRQDSERYHHSDDGCQLLFEFWCSFFKHFPNLEYFEYLNIDPMEAADTFPMLTRMTGGNIILAALARQCPRLKALKMTSWSDSNDESLGEQLNNSFKFRYGPRVAAALDIAEPNDGDGEKHILHGPTEAMLRIVLERWYKSNGGLHILDITHPILCANGRDDNFYSMLMLYTPDLRYVGGEGYQRLYYYLDDTLRTEQKNVTTTARLNFLRACTRLEALDLTASDGHMHEVQLRREWTHWPQDHREDFLDDALPLLKWKYVLKRIKESLDAETFSRSEGKYKNERGGGDIPSSGKHPSNFLVVSSFTATTSAAGSIHPQKASKYWHMTTEEEASLWEQAAKEVVQFSRSQVKVKVKPSGYPYTLLDAYSTLSLPQLRHIRLTQEKDLEQIFTSMDVVSLLKCAPYLEEFVLDRYAVAFALDDIVMAALRDLCPRLRYIYAMIDADRHSIRWNNTNDSWSNNAAVSNSVLTDRGLYELARMKSLEFAGFTTYGYFSAAGLADFFVEATNVTPCSYHTVYSSASVPENIKDIFIDPSRHVILAVNVIRQLKKGEVYLEKVQADPNIFLNQFEKELTKKSRIDTLRRNLGVYVNNVGATERDKSRKRDVTVIFSIAERFGVGGRNEDEVVAADDGKGHAKSAEVALINQSGAETVEERQQSDEDGGEYYERFTCNDVCCKISSEDLGLSTVAIAFTTNFSAYKKARKQNQFPWLNLPLVYTSESAADY